VRELANVIERAVVLADHDTLLPEDLDFPNNAGLEALLQQGADGNIPLEELEREYVRRVLEEHGGKQGGRRAHPGNQSADSLPEAQGVDHATSGRGQESW